MNEPWMIYGASGYSGRLIARQAKRDGLTPILAARGEAAVTALAEELQLESRAFALDDPAAIRAALKDVRVLANCAGPFSATSAPLRAACRDVRCHYLDITGEFSVFEASHGEDAAARQAGVVVCPGVGFDVIPTDCLAATLKADMPDATSLALGFDSDSGLSKGTATTAVEGLAVGNVVRQDGKLRRVPLGYSRRQIDFGRGLKTAATIPWGDVATAYFSTGIPEIAVFVPIPKAVAIGMRMMNPLRPLLATAGIQQWLKRQVAKRITGPSEAARGRDRTFVWGEARNRSGERRVARIETANGYDVTVFGMLMSVRHLLSYDGPGGYFTPSQLLGERCVESLPGSGKIVFESSLESSSDPQTFNMPRKPRTA